MRLLLQGKLDYRFAGLAASVLYDELLSRGVRIYEYTPAFLHAKVALADDDWATVGSSNIDPLSLLLNLEANVVVRDATFTAALAAAFERAIAQSREVSAPPTGPWLDGRRAPNLRRLGRAVVPAACRHHRPILMAAAGSLRSRRLGLERAAAWPVAAQAAWARPAAA